MKLCPFNGLTEIIIEEFLRSVVVSILYSLSCLTFNIYQNFQFTHGSGRISTPFNMQHQTCSYLQ